MRDREDSGKHLFSKEQVRDHCGCRSARLSAAYPSFLLNLSPFSSVTGLWRLEGGLSFRCDSVAPVSISLTGAGRLSWRPLRLLIRQREQSVLCFATGKAASKQAVDCVMVRLH